MKKYQYQILRYVHDWITGEFVNVGIVVYSPEESFLKATMTKRFGRITNFFPHASGQYLLRKLRHIEKEVKRQNDNIQSLFEPSKDLSVITAAILPKDDSALVFAQLEHGIDINAEAALATLYEQFVEKYQAVEETHSQSDDDVWRQAYKAYFEKYRVINRFKEFEVSTQNDNIHFDMAWKNEIWHCYQPLSFNLQQPDTIKNKVYKWSGILNELETADEALDLTLLIAKPQIYPQLFSFIQQSLTRQNKIVKVSIVTEEGAEKVAREIRDAIDAHDGENN